MSASTGSSHTGYTFVVEGVRIVCPQGRGTHRSPFFQAYFINKDAKEEDLKDVRYVPFRMLIDYIYLDFHAAGAGQARQGAD